MTFRTLSTPYPASFCFQSSHPPVSVRSTCKSDALEVVNNEDACLSGDPCMLSRPCGSLQKRLKGSLEDTKVSNVPL